MCHRITERTPLAVWILYHCQLSSVFVQLCQITFLFLTKYLSSFEFCEHYQDVNHPLYLVTVVISWLRTEDAILWLRMLSPRASLHYWGHWGWARAGTGAVTRGWDTGTGGHWGDMGGGGVTRPAHTDYCAPLLSQEGADINDSPFNGHLLLPLDNKEISGSLRDMMMSWVFIPNDALSDNDWWMSHNLNCVILGVQCPPPPRCHRCWMGAASPGVIHHLLSLVTLWLTITQPSLDTIQSVLQIPL